MGTHWYSKKRRGKRKSGKGIKATKRETLSATEELEYVKDLALEKFRYRKRFISNYPLLLMFFMLLLFMAYLFESAASIIAALIGMGVLGILLKITHENRIKKDEQPTTQEYRFAAQIMFFCCYVGAGYTVIAVFVTIILH